uniref:Uncharacterized protein n=1 Tax=Ditylenchus dipsaci TaxID=166011 RepID=A0A915DWB8_9BILA
MEMRMVSSCYMCSRHHPPRENIFKEGNTDKWDVTVLCMAIQGVSRATKKLAQSTSSKTQYNYKSEDRLITVIRRTRNQVSHCAKPVLSDDEFTKRNEKLYVNGGKNNFDEEPAQLKTQADKCFRDKKYGEAISIYKEILKFESVGTEQQPIIYSNISASYLLLDTPEFVKKAVEYAKQCVMMRPTCLESYQQTSAIELSSVEYDIGKKDRQDDYQRVLPTEEEQYEMVSSHFGISVDDFLERTRKFHNIPTLGGILDGLKHRDGSGGVKQDYAKAANYFVKAATGGNPEGMYYLALLYARGHGVQCDMKTSLMWLKKAAEMPTNNNFRQNGCCSSST